MESSESRFAHLLQPIRELTKNWEIDVASELKDYLEELDDMCITFDGGKIRLNFAEAALLIQGSACIYSKKVELLHSMVYQTLEYISDKNKKQSKAKAAQQGDAGEVASSHEADDREEFTSLGLEASENSQKSNSTVKVTRLPPESLIPPEPQEKYKLPLISLKGEVVCSQKDFRINLFIPGEEELILLMLGSAANRIQLDEPPSDERIQQWTVTTDDDGAADAVDDFLPIEDNNNMEVEQNPEEHAQRHQASAMSDGRAIRDRRQLEAEKQRREVEVQSAVNLWMLHDPYAVLGEDKLLKTGKCYTVPDGVDDGGKRKRKRASKLQDFRSWFRGTFNPPEIKLKNGPTFTDLNYIYLSTLKGRVKTQKRICRRAGVMISEEELRRTLLQPEEAGPQQQGEDPADVFRHPDLMGGDDDDSDNEQEAFPDDIPAEFGGAPDFVSPDTQKDELMYEDLVKLRVEQLLFNSHGYIQESSLSRRVKDWEDKVKPELELQEKRPPFDIHDYGERIVGALSSIGHRRSFAAIVHGLDNFEACKYLLASLQLANDYTVEIDSNGVLEESLDTMSLTLLSTLRATDRFKTLSAST